MADAKRPILELTLVTPTDLASLQKLTDIAEALGFLAKAPVTLQTIGQTSITVRDWLDNTTVPVEDDGAEA